MLKTKHLWKHYHLQACKRKLLLYQYRICLGLQLFLYSVFMINDKYVRTVLCTIRCMINDKLYETLSYSTLFESCYYSSVPARD